MAGKSWPARPGCYTSIVDWFQGADLTISRQTNPLRTVYNAQTHSYEEVPLAQFQQLLRQGKIEEVILERADCHPQTTYRFV